MMSRRALCCSIGDAERGAVVEARKTALLVGVRLLGGGMM